MFMADCGVIPEPTVDQLADIAVSTAQLARQLLGKKPRVALLSYSTKGSATHPSIGRVQAATHPQMSLHRGIWMEQRLRIR
jgi:phosphotransacetylase